MNGGMSAGMSAATSTEPEPADAEEFWVSSGHLLLERNADGGLAITDEFLKAYLARPEIVPPDDACPAERALHARLLIAPTDPVAERDIDAIQDTDARENWRVLIGFRDRLIRHGTVEGAYLSLVRGGVGATPKMFLDQLVHVILRNALDGETDSFVLRAAELFFRPQRLSIHDGRLLLADEEVVDGRRDAVAPAHALHASPLTAMFGAATSGELDVLTLDNASDYRARSDAFDMALDFAEDGAARRALGSVIERWIGHLLGVGVEVRSLPRIDDSDWAWFVGLDAEATALGNRLWTGQDVAEVDRARIVALYALRFADPATALPRIDGRNVYLLLAMGEDRIVRMKPQNLIVGLPLAGQGN